MREILFRAKRIDNEEWVEGSYLYCKKATTFSFRNEHYILVFDGYGVAYHEIDPDTICQYTGLTDKNGNKIWENDIVKCNYNDYGEKGTYIGKVILREDTCTFIVTDGKSTDYEWWNEKKEVIGNIFANADFLKGE